MAYKNIDQAKINDPSLRREWADLLGKLEMSLNRLNSMDLAPEGDAQNLQYFEAVNDFIEARDRERAFFWDNLLKRQPVG